MISSRGPKRRAESQRPETNSPRRLYTRDLYQTDPSSKRLFPRSGSLPFLFLLFWALAQLLWSASTLGDHHGAHPTRPAQARKTLDQTPSNPVPPPPARFVFKSGTLPQLAPDKLEQRDRFEYYSALSAHLGLPIEGRIVVIGFRGVAPNRQRHPSSHNASNYDDTFVILDPSSGKVWELLGSTHAGQFRSTLAPAGVAQIQPGLFQADPCGEFADMPCWLVTTRGGEERIPCWRDADGDGEIGVLEKNLSTTATEILFHNGRYDDHGSSIGCQVLAPHLMKTFIRAVGKKNPFDYLLLDANSPL